MVQLRATSAIEYVAAGHFFPVGLLAGGLLAGGIFVREGFCPGDFFPGSLLPGGTFGLGDFWPGGFCPGGLLFGGSFARGDFCPGAYARSPQVQCVYAPSRLSVPSMIYVYPAGGRIQLT